MAFEFHTGLAKPLPDIRKSTLDRSEARNFRLQCRNNEINRSTSGFAPQHVQVNFFAVPKSDAFDFLLFCLKNPRPCPLLEVTEAGDRISKTIAPGADIATDLPAYNIMENGKVTKIVKDASPYWRDDLVSFLLGCSFTFDQKLTEAGLPPKHLVQDVEIPLYESNIPMNPVGKFQGNMIVSMRPYKKKDLKRVIEITSRYQACHGGPIHIGDPGKIGLLDEEGHMIKPFLGDELQMENDEVPVFWPCGVSPQNVLEKSEISYAVTQGPNQVLLVSDLLTDEIATTP